MSIDVKNRQTKYCISDPVMHTKKQRLILYLKPINVVHHNESLRKKNHMITTFEAEKAGQNSASIHYKNSQHIRNRKELP